MSERPGNHFGDEVTEDDKTWAMFCYVLPVFGSLAVMTAKAKRERPFIRAHYLQALILGGVMWLATFTGCGWMPLFIYSVYLGLAKARHGDLITIPFVTDALKNLGWA